MKSSQLTPSNYYLPGSNWRIHFSYRYIVRVGRVNEGLPSGGVSSKLEPSRGESRICGGPEGYKRDHYCTTYILRTAVLYYYFWYT